jgi:hypothetical protein
LQLIAVIEFEKSKIDEPADVAGSRI